MIPANRDLWDDAFDDFSFNAAWDDNAAEVIDDDSQRRTACIDITTDYLYRRAYSEVSLLEAMQYTPLTMGHSYHFLTGGDVDSISYLKIVLNTHALDDLLLSTWCANAQDITQLTQWYDTGKIRHLDMFIGENFPTSYAREYFLINEFYRTHPDAGTATVFRNHCKVYAGADRANDFYFVIETSANINTNPRTEQGIITCHQGLYEFYRTQFDEIRTTKGKPPKVDKLDA